MAKQLLNDVTIRSTKPGDKDKRLNDGGGLYLLIKTNGAKWWRFDYSFQGKRKTLSLGVYPSTGLADARRKADEARTNVANGVNPSDTRKETKAAQKLVIENEKRLDAGLAVIDSFEHVAKEWYEKRMLNKSESHRKRTLSSLERDIFPWIGRQLIADIKAPELLTVLQRIESRGAIETAHRALQTCGQVFRYAEASGRVDRDITQALKGALTAVNGSNFSSMTDPQQIGPLLRAIDDYNGSFVVKSALQLAPLVFVRPSELRQAEWEHIDLETKEWRYLVTKTKTQHIVPLSKQAVEILTNIHPLTGNGRFVFPSARTPNGSRAMSDVALLAALRRMGFDKTEMTVHGFRAMARTILDEVLGFRPDFIEHQLAHAVKDPNGRAYNRTAHLSERRKMMQTWADYLDSLKADADVIPFRKQG
ncbi:tyrosine-type recombinase/integrase [Methylobacter luteus]|uniref:tyrosine-type recombinase/integrase n=1 Tax=Methylobacter luteus TaxID=415 RepID=UPI000401A50B|nr:integrase arm-type DNA-binding domain-containing protein [Methylobacter luteus]